MASLLATVATIPDTSRLDSIDDSTAVDSPSFQSANSALVKMAADEVDTAFSPLSSSAITIASLGSSLGYGSGTKRNSGSSRARQPVDKVLGADSTLEEDIEERHDAAQLGLRGAVTAAQDDSLVTSSANLSTAVSSSAVSSHSSKSSTSSAGPSMGMSKVNMRSVSVDYAHAYGLHIKHTMASSGDDSNASSPAETVPPLPAHPLRTAHYHRSESGISSSATSLSGIHRTLTKKFWRPLARKSGEHDTATSAKSAFRQQPLAIDADEEDLPLSDSEASIVVQSHRYPESKVHSSQDTCADNGIVERNSVANASEGTQQGERPVLPLDTVVATPATTPHPSAVAPYQPRNYRFSRAVTSKSLDAPRIAKGPADEESKGALNRRVLQRAKREDAIYGVVATNPAVESKGPERFQALPRSFVSRLGFASTLAARRRSDDLRFVIAPHPQFAEITEVYDCEERTPVYRKISRSGRSWHETFHEVNFEEELAELEAAKQHMYWRQQHCLQQRHSSYVIGGGSDVMAMSDYEMASALGLPYPGLAAYGGRPTTFASAAAASCVTIQSSAAGTSSYANGGMSNQSTASFLLNSGTVRMARASTSMGGRGFSHVSESGASSGGVSFDRGLLWEALTPYPNQFPLHVKDARTIIDTVSLASMVLDRHQFCYRFQLGANRMRWTAKRARKHQLALVCSVRSTVVAEIFVDYEKGYSPYGLPSVLGEGLAGAAAKVAPRAAGFMSSSSSSGVSTPREQPNNGTGAINQAIDIGLPEDGSYPLVTILPAAFAQLVDFDSDVVESFIIFTGMQMLECLHM
ncbi:hypothetical protein GGI19_005425 [Coemansia pectinata]|uniref:Uncharacterized protein n=1 Tax=Coemansia pectinata TaxID=1052879 RepID=A0A9W8GSB3_9FUNG|nr:hypothetical protein GGI19_005425 [Coemansia pectinata]